MTSSLFKSFSSAFDRLTVQSSQQPQLAFAGFPTAARPPLTQRPTVIARSSASTEERPVINEEDNILHLDVTQWDRVLEESKKQTVIIDIWAEWCKSCDKASDHFYKVADKNRNKPITFIKFDIADDKVISKQLGLKVLPCVRIYKNGECDNT